MLKATSSVLMGLSYSAAQKSAKCDPKTPKTPDLNGKKIFLPEEKAQKLFKLYPEVHLDSLQSPSAACELLKEIFLDILPKKVPAECAPKKNGDNITVFISKNSPLYTQDLAQINNLLSK